MMSTPPYSLVPESAGPGWSDRHPHGKIALGGMVLLLLVLVSGGGVLLGMMASIRNSVPYWQAMTSARSDARVIATLGQPVEPNFLFLGFFETRGLSGHENFSLPLSGPGGKGMLHVCAVRDSGDWHLQTLQFSSDGRTERIDLLQPTARPSPIE